MSIELEVVVGQEDVSDDALEQAAGGARGAQPNLAVAPSGYLRCGYQFS